MIMSLMRLTLVFSLLFLISGSSLADKDGDFTNGYRLLERGEYLQAYNIFMQLYETGRKSADADRYLYYRAKSAYHAEMYSESRADFGRLIVAYRQSSYIPYSHFFLGNIHYRANRFGQAVESYLMAYIQSSDKELTSMAARSIAGTAGAPDAAVVKRINSAAIPDSRRCRLIVAVARELINSTNFQSARTLLESCNTEEALRLYTKTAQMIQQQPGLGVVLPLSGELQRFGEALLDGIRLGIDQYIAQTGEDIKLTTYDTGGKNLEAARVIRALSEEDIAAVIGPLTSEETAVASAVLSCGDMPMIAPAASQAGLTQLSSSCFQLRPNLDRQGIRMAEFAHQELGCDTAAIITPTSAEQLSMAEAFSNRFRQMGGTVLATEYFRVRETDFGPFVKDVKSLILGELLDSIIFITDEGDTIEAEAVPVWIDCIYIPADQAQLKMLLPQINFYNLNTVLLGGDGWGNKSVYRLGDNVTGKCFFSSAQIEDQENDAYLRFAHEFDLAYGRRPGHLEALGYDAAVLLTEAFRTRNYSRPQITQYLKSINGFNGTSGTISFGDFRENTEMPVFTIEYGEPKRVFEGDRTIDEKYRINITGEDNE